MNRAGRIALKTLLWILGIVIFLVVLVVILIQVPSVQNFAKNKVVNYLQEKIKTKVQINRLSVEFPKLIVLEGVYFADQKGDTLIAGNKMKVDISMFQLLHSKVEVNEINFQGITANVIRTPDSVFNYDYISKAFMSEQKKEPQKTDTSSTLKFSLDKVILDNIHIRYSDAISGNDIRFLLTHFDTRVKDFDMDKMKFNIPKITLAGFDAKIVQTPSGTLAPTGPDTASTPINLDLKLDVIDLSKIHVDYTGKEMKTNVTLGKFLVNVDKIDLKNQDVNLKSIELADTRSMVTLLKPETVKKAIVKAVKKLDTIMAAPTSGKPWALKLGKLSLKNNDVKFDNDAQAPMKGFDYMHMNVRNLNAEFENFVYSKDITGRINSFSFSDKSGLAVKQFHTSFLYGDKQSYLNDLYLETPNSVLQNQVQISYPSISAIADNLGLLHINANVVGSKVSLKDVLLIMPNMSSMEPFKHSPNAVFRLSTSVIGNLNNLSIPSMDVTGLSHTHVKASGTIKGLPDMNKAYFDLRIADLTTNKADINRLAPAGSIPSNINIPNALSASGTFKGGMTNFNTNLKLHSTDGSVDGKVALKMGPGKNNMVYDADVKAYNLNVGKLIGQSKNVGVVTLAAKVKGSGTDLKTANATFSGNMVRASIRGYGYQDLTFKGSANHGAIATVANMKDPNLNFALDLKADMSKKYPSVNMNLVVDSANIQRLGFSKDPMRFHGKVVADVPTADPDYLNGNIAMTDILFINKDHRIRMDSVSVVATATPDSSTLNLKSQLITAHLGGKYKLTELGVALQDDINKYFNMNAGSKQPKPKYSPTSVNFSAVISKTPVMIQFVPDLKHLDPVRLSGSFDSESGKLIVNGSAPRIVYGTNTINALNLNINTNNNALNYNITLAEIKASQIDLINTSISGNAQNNKLNTSIQVRDAKNKERYRIAGVFDQAGTDYRFSLLPTGLLLDYTAWTVNADNAIEFGSNGVLARNFNISNSGQTLSITSNPPQLNAPLHIAFTNFRIETLTKLAQQNSLLVGGVINGTADVKNLDKTAEFTSDLNINDFNFKGDTVGNIALKVNNQTANTLAANMAITGKGNQVNLDGFYYTDKSSFDLNLDIVNLNLKSIEGFSFGNLRRSSGAINGKLKITGTTDIPVIRGDLNFNNAAFNITKINTYYRAPKEKVTFNSDGILFNDFTLIDSAGNKAVVTGNVYTTNYTSYKFGLDINTSNFRVFNAVQSESKLYYGQIYLDSQIKIRGDMDRPIVDATLKINDKTDLTIVIPQDDPAMQDRKGVVEFVNKKAPKLDSIMKQQLDSLKKSSLVGMDISANITVDKNAAFTIVVDERNGDIVHLKGDAQLNLGIDISGKTSLTGTYTVNSGSYDLAYATVNRKFLIKQGSTVTWEGDPTMARLDVTAIYVAKVPPIDLVANQLASETERTMYKTKLPFNVNLRLQNELMKPDISFGITLPDSTYTVTSDVISTVNAKLDQLRQDPNELNKQVFAVLLLNHFVGENPFQSQGGSEGLAGTVRSSVSSLLSDQLNNLAGNLIEGVDVNFALQSGADYSSGTSTNRTDLNVGLSKRFLNDRLTVTVGNNFNLEGQQANEKATNIAGDISVGYKLTADGRYMIRAYRRDQFIVIQGQVIETGVGFSLTVDYNRISQIFTRSKAVKEMKAKQKEEDKKQKEEQKQVANEQKQSQN
ncbi:translocation/assembly module TamB [Mucilaginibacter sp. HMF5004]|uniref:translocation/assembly module TamB domain-containing protein n=1 Tax=Mucilaginibacter rivuli TaxID=2857527 RepID=UPI001C5D8AE6|nr:translocation/assembly module TamB domain-containing protein [Mucilaginibacter rivuli]MBW4890827.1 translocation/assembly module TamB [Mucilaginibacter rivuli]